MNDTELAEYYRRRAKRADKMRQYLDTVWNVGMALLAVSLLGVAFGLGLRLAGS